MEKRTYAVIGLGDFGISVVQELSRLNKEVIAIDVSEERVRKASKFSPLVFIADATDEKALEELDISNITDAIIAFGDNIQATILATIHVKSLNVPNIIVRVDDDYYGNVLLKLGATQIIYPLKFAGRGLANRLSNKDFLDFYELSGEFSVVKVIVGDDFKELTIHDLDPRNKYDANIVLLTRDNVTISPKGENTIKAGDILYVVGNQKCITKLNDILHGVKKVKK